MKKFKDYVPMLLGAAVMVALWALMPILAAAGAENAFKINIAGDHVAVFPSAWAGMKMMSAWWWISAISISVIGGLLAGRVIDNAEAGQKITPFVGIGLVTIIIAYTLMLAPALFNQDFTHVTMPIEQFSKDVAARGGYDHLFQSFLQTDLLYTTFP